MDLKENIIPGPNLKLPDEEFQNETGVGPEAAPSEFIPPSSQQPTFPGQNVTFVPGEAVSDEVPQKEDKTFIFEEEEGVSGKIKKLFPKVLIILVVLIGIFSFLKFIFPRFTGSQEITLTWWGLWEPDSVASGVISDYQKSHPKIKINYVFQSVKDYRERLASSLAQGKGPDIFRFHNTWVPMFKNDLATVPSKIMDTATFEASFYPVTRNDLRQGQAYLGIPLEIDGLGLFINEEIFEAAGKTFPTTWDELRKTALELTTRDSSGKIQIAGVALGRTENVDHWSDILALMMLQNGADLSKPQGQLAEDSLTYFSLFSKVDRVWDDTLPRSTMTFSGGRLAMYFGPSWEVFEIKKANPDLKFQVIPVPQLEGTNITWASYWVEGVAKKSKNQEAAWEFLKYISQKETLQKLYQAESQIRLFGEPYSRVDMADLIKGDQYAGAFIRQAQTARSWYLASRTFDNGLNDKMIKYFEDAVNSVNSGKTAKEALETTVSGVAQILAQYGISASVVPR